MLESINSGKFLISEIKDVTSGIFLWGEAKDVAKVMGINSNNVNEITLPFFVIISKRIRKSFL